MGLPTLGRDRPQSHFRAEHFHDGFNLEDSKASPFGLPLVGAELPGQLAMQGIIMYGLSVALFEVRIGSRSESFGVVETVAFISVNAKHLAKSAGLTGHPFRQNST
jgi:hypothetical protein